MREIMYKSVVWITEKEKEKGTQAGWNAMNEKRVEQGTYVV